MKKIIEILPKKLKDSAISLNSIGIENMAWKYNDCIEAIEFLADNNFFILGGDVYSYENGNINSTYDSWYTNKNDLLSRKDLIELGKSRSLLYIKNYKKLNGDNYSYSIVVE